MSFAMLMRQLLSHPGLGAGCPCSQSYYRTGTFSPTAQPAGQREGFWIEVSHNGQ